MMPPCAVGKPEYPDTKGVEGAIVEGAILHLSAPSSAPSTGSHHSHVSASTAVEDAIFKSGGRVWASSGVPLLGYYKKRMSGNSHVSTLLMHTLPIYRRMTQETEAAVAMGTLLDFFGEDMTGIVEEVAKEVLIETPLLVTAYCLDPKNVTKLTAAEIATAKGFLVNNATGAKPSRAIFSRTQSMLRWPS